MAHPTTPMSAFKTPALKQTVLREQNKLQTGEVHLRKDWYPDGVLLGHRTHKKATKPEGPRLQPISCSRNGSPASCPWCAPPTEVSLGCGLSPVTRF